MRMRVNIAIFMHFLLMSICIKNCTGRYRVKKFIKEPQTSNSSSVGFRCATQNPDTARGMKFDTSNSACGVLSDDWFSGTPTYEASHLYYLLSLWEDEIEPSLTFDMDLPSNFHVGCSLVLYVKTGAVGSTGYIAMILADSDDTMQALYMNVRENENTLLFNSLIGGSFGYEERNDNPFKTSEQVYKLEFKITSQHVETYIDDSHFYSYSHRTSVSNYQHLSYFSSYTECTRVQFLYPV